MTKSQLQMHQFGPGDVHPTHHKPGMIARGELKQLSGAARAGAGYVFDGVAEQAGAVLWPELAGQYIQHSLRSRCEAATANGAEALRRVTAEAEALEAEACRLGYCPQV